MSSGVACWNSPMWSSRTRLTSATSSTRLCLMWDGAWMSLPPCAMRVHLLPPGVPEVGEAVDHDDERTAAERRVVDLHAVLRGRVPVFDAIENVDRKSVV